MYSVSVEAKNAAGTGDAASVPSGSNNVSVTPTPTAPTPPQDLTVTPGNRTLTLSWDEPADDGGTTFTGYTIESRCGTVSRFSPVYGSPQPHNTTRAIQTITIRGLVNGTHCDVRVAANSYYDADRNNFRGSNEPILSSPWAQGFGTPATSPFAPTNVMVTTAHESLQVSWAPPTNTGGSDITGYKLTWSAGIPATVTIGNRTTYMITGLENRFAYTVRVKTITAVGESTAVVRQRQHTTQHRTRSAKKRSSQHSTAADQRQHQRPRRHKPGSHLGCTAAQWNQPGRRLCGTTARLPDLLHNPGRHPDTGGPLDQHGRRNRKCHKQDRDHRRSPNRQVLRHPSPSDQRPRHQHQHRLNRWPMGQRIRNPGNHARLSHAGTRTRIHVDYRVMGSTRRQRQRHHPLPHQVCREPDR